LGTRAAQTDEDLVSEPRDLSRESAVQNGRRAAGGRSYMSGFFSNNGIVPSPLLKRPSAVTTPMRVSERLDVGHGGMLEPGGSQVIMDGSQNLGQVRPAGAMSPISSGTSPRTGAKWNLGSGGVRASAIDRNNETTQPISEEVMPANRRSFR
jgi:hypothetical protein